MTAKRPWIEFVEAIGVTADGEVFVPVVIVEPVDDQSGTSGDTTSEPDSIDEN